MDIEVLAWILAIAILLAIPGIPLLIGLLWTIISNKLNPRIETRYYDDDDDGSDLSPGWDFHEERGDID